MTSRRIYVSPYHSPLNLLTGLTTNALNLLSYQPPQPHQPTIYIYIYIYIHTHTSVHTHTHTHTLTLTHTHYVVTHTNTHARIHTYTHTHTHIHTHSLTHTHIYISDATWVGVGDGFGSSREDAGKALQTPLQACEHTIPPQRCGVAEEVYDFSVDGEDRPARTQHHAAPSTGASRQRRCGVALPTPLWERRAEESLSAALESMSAAREQPPAPVSSDTSSASHSLSALLQSDSVASSGADRRAGQEGPAAMSAGKTRPAVRTTQRESLGSQKCFMPSPFAAFAGQGTQGEAPGADGPITDLLTRTGGGLMRDSARHCAAPRAALAAAAAAAVGEEGRAETEGVVAAGSKSSMNGARRLRTALTRESDRARAREKEKGMEGESE